MLSGKFASHNSVQLKPTSVEAFHHSQEQTLTALLESKKPLPPAALQSFVQSYIRDYNAQFTRPNHSKRKALFKQASEHHIKLYQAKLFSASTFADVAILMEEFTKYFPEGDSSLIHYQDNDVFKSFSATLVDVLQRTYQAGAYTTTAKPFRCADAVLLQSLAKLPLATSTKSIIPTTITAPKKRGKQQYNAILAEKYGKNLNAYGRIIADLIDNTTKFINEKKQPSPAAITMTAAALSSFDIDAFKTNLTSTITQNQVIENFINACLNKEATLKDAADIVRLMHAIILLSPADNRMKYLPEGLAASLLNSIDSLQLRPTDRSLANQLFFIKNVYKNVFPASLEKEIAPFVSSFQAQSHGSHFESVIHKEIFKAVKALQTQYPGLIDPAHLDFNNPISAELGLESDVAYLDDELKVCMQIDGDKYHRYLGSERETQRTKLRDYCFETQQWKIAKFSDSKHGVSEVKDQLLETIVIPTYEMKTRQNIQKIGHLSADLVQAQKALATFVADDTASELLKALKQELAQATLTLKKQPNAVAELVRLEKEIAKIEMQLKQDNLIAHEILDSQIASAQEQLTQFDISSAKQLAVLSRVYLAAKEQLLHLPAKQIELTQVLSDLDENIDIKSKALKAIEEKLSAKNQEIENLTSLISEKQAIANKAKIAHEQYDVSQRTETFNRAIAKKNMEDTKNDVDLLNIDLYQLESAAKLIRAEVTKHALALEALLPKQAIVSEELSTTLAQLAQANNTVKMLQSTLQAPVVGSEVLQQSNELMHKIKTIESAKAKAIAQLKDYRAQITKLSQLPMTMPTTPNKPTVKPTLPTPMSTSSAFPVTSGYPSMSPGYGYGYGPIGYYPMPMPYYPPHGHYPVSGGYYAYGPMQDYGYEEYEEEYDTYAQPPMLTSYQSQPLPPFIQQQQATRAASSSDASNSGYKPRY